MSENFRTQAEEILESLGLFLGLDDLEFGEDDDTCGLRLDEKMLVSLTLNQERETIVLHHLIGTLPVKNRAELVEQLLEANLFWSGANGATISMERETGFVIIARAFSLYTSDGKLLTGEFLANAIADLASASNYWQDFLEHPNIETELPEGNSNQTGEELVDATKFD
ncbi:MAG: type III secretion system chaperone [Verrucomicrobia bacterium]|nr:type III secretion system chaperone [Verrucomicrobiota bacterium]